MRFWSFINTIFVKSLKNSTERIIYS